MKPVIIYKPAIISRRTSLVEEVQIQLKVPVSTSTGYTAQRTHQQLSAVLPPALLRWAHLSGYVTNAVDCTVQPRHHTQEGIDELLAAIDEQAQLFAARWIMADGPLQQKIDDAASSATYLRNAFDRHYRDNNDAFSRVNKELHNLRQQVHAFDQKLDSFRTKQEQHDQVSVVTWYPEIQPSPFDRLLSLLRLRQIDPFTRYEKEGQFIGIFTGPEHMIHAILAANPATRHMPASTGGWLSIVKRHHDAWLDEVDW